jgi:hypothetical protein
MPVKDVAGEGEVVVSSRGFEVVVSRAESVVVVADTVVIGSGSRPPAVVTEVLSAQAADSSVNTNTRIDLGTTSLPIRTLRNHSFNSTSACPWLYAPGPLAADFGIEFLVSQFSPTEDLSEHEQHE